MADAIWNDRYLLSNMTSEKLYAKSPLTTGVSGTSAYIGLEPSATYNETVLYSGAPVTGGSLALSDSWDNYEKLQINSCLTAGWTTAGRPQHTDILATDMFEILMASIQHLWKTSNGSVYLRTLSIEAQAGTSALVLANNMQVEFKSNGTMTNTSGDQLGITKVIGINRKEV